MSALTWFRCIGLAEGQRLWYISGLGLGLFPAVIVLSTSHLTGSAILWNDIFFGCEHSNDMRFSWYAMWGLVLTICVSLTIISSLLHKVVERLWIAPETILTKTTWSHASHTFQWKTDLILAFVANINCQAHGRLILLSNSRSPHVMTYYAAMNDQFVPQWDASHIKKSITHVCTGSLIGKTGRLIVSSGTGLCCRRKDWVHPSMQQLDWYEQRIWSRFAA